MGKLAYEETNRTKSSLALGGGSVSPHAAPSADSRLFLIFVAHRHCFNLRCLHILVLSHLLKRVHSNYFSIEVYILKEYAFLFLFMKGLSVLGVVPKSGSCEPPAL